MKYSLGLILLISYLPTVGQTSVYVNGVAGQYDMTDLKSFQSEQINQLALSTGLPVKSEVSFPYSIGLEAGADFTLNSRSTTLGGFASYTLTKGRFGYRDYSGEATSTQNVSRYGLGLKLEGSIHKKFHYFLKAGSIYNKLELYYLESLTGIGAINKSLNLHSYSVVFQPGLSWSYFIRKLYFQVQAGYEINLRSKTYLDSDNSAYLQDSKHNNISIDWSGIRMGLGIGYRFSKD